MHINWLIGEYNVLFAEPISYYITLTFHIVFYDEIARHCDASLTIALLLLLLVV